MEVYGYPSLFGEEVAVIGQTERAIVPLTENEQAADMRFVKQPAALQDELAEPAYATQEVSNAA